MIERLPLLVVVAALYGAVFWGIEKFAKGTSVSDEVVRKLAHIIAGLGAALFPIFLGFTEIALVGALLAVSVVAAVSMNMFTSVRQVDRITYGEVLFPLAITCVALIFPDPLLYIYAIATLGLADALAAILGRVYGRKTFHLLNPKKTYVGSTVFLVVTFIIGVVLLYGAGTPPLAVLGVSAVLAVLLTVVEAVSDKGFDNLTVPLAAASLLWVASLGGFLS
jgi:phytol kinase